MTLQIGILLALACAFATNLGFLYKHRGAVESPPVEARRPVRTSLALFRSRWYTLGILIAMAGWGLHVGALALAPISLVQTVIAGGLVMLTAIADRFFAHRVTRREWIGVGLAAAGLAFLAATLNGGARDAHGDYGAEVLAIYIGAAAGLAALAAVCTVIFARLAYALVVDLRTLLDRFFAVRHNVLLSRTKRRAIRAASFFLYSPKHDSPEILKKCLGFTATDQ